ncbi:MAG: hypothetical protein Q6356_003220 [Candidatus Wukongarchaeota archaeon]|nr:hypothetical protein [Candidatus Wukongarchaeota archaeon]
MNPFCVDTSLLKAHVRLMKKLPKHLRKKQWGSKVYRCPVCGKRR